MEYEKLILSMAERITDLEERVSALEKGNMSKQVAEASKGSKKYRYLSEYLSNSNQKSVSHSTLSYFSVYSSLNANTPCPSFIGKYLLLIIKLCILLFSSLNLIK